MGYSIFCDWLEEFKHPDKWENYSYRVICEILEDKEHKQFKEVVNKCEILENGELREYWDDDIRGRTTPIYNYIYPLEFTPKDEDILKVTLKTNCTVLLNTENNIYYLSLTGCGMDLSQDIALSYILLNERIPMDLINSVSTQKDSSVNGEDWKILRSSVISQTKQNIDNAKRKLKEWEDTAE